jgi:hypothetical protein
MCNFIYQWVSEFVKSRKLSLVFWYILVQRDDLLFDSPCFFIILGLQFSMLSAYGAIDWWTDNYFKWVQIISCPLLRLITIFQNFANTLLIFGCLIIKFVCCLSEFISLFLIIGESWSMIWSLLKIIEIQEVIYLSFASTSDELIVWFWSAHC